MLPTFNQIFFKSIVRSTSTQPPRPPPDPEFMKNFYKNMENECNKRKSSLELSKDVLKVWIPKILQLINSSINPIDIHGQIMILNTFIGMRTVEELYQYIECYHSVNPLKRQNINKKKDLLELKKVFAHLLDEISKIGLLELIQRWCQKDRSDVIEYIKDALYVLHPEILGAKPAPFVALLAKAPAVPQPAAQRPVIQPAVLKAPLSIPKPIVKAPFPSIPQPSPNPQLKPSPIPQPKPSLAIPQPVNKVPLVETPTKAVEKKMTPVNEYKKIYRPRDRNSSLAKTTAIRSGPRPAASSANTARGVKETIENGNSGGTSSVPSVNRGERRLTGRGIATARDSLENRPPRNPSSKAIFANREGDRRDLRSKHPQGSQTNQSVTVKGEAPKEATPPTAAQAIREPRQEPPKKAQNTVKVNKNVNGVDFELNFDLPDDSEFEDWNVGPVADVPAPAPTPKTVPKTKDTEAKKADSRNPSSRAIPAIGEGVRRRDLLRAKHPQGSQTNQTVTVNEEAPQEATPTAAAQAIREPKQEPPKKAQNTVKVNKDANGIDFELNFDLPVSDFEDWNVGPVADVPAPALTPKAVPKTNDTEAKNVDLSKVKLEPFVLPVATKNLKRGIIDDGEIEIITPYKFRRGVSVAKKSPHQNKENEKGGYAQIKLGLYIDPALDDPALSELPIGTQYRFEKTTSFFPITHSCKTMIYVVKDKDALKNEELPEGITMLMVVFDANMKGLLKKVPGHKGPTRLLTEDVRIMVEEMNNRRHYDMRMAKKEQKMAQKMKNA